MNYAKAIKELREKMILTQAEFAEMLGVSFNSVNRWENGAYTPTIKIKRKLAKLFDENGITLEVKENAGE